VSITESFCMGQAYMQAVCSLIHGGIPIGAVLVLDGKIIGKGYNKRVQKNSAILHAEMDCLENAGRLTPEQYQRCTIYSTLAPCYMCAGAIALYKIARVVIGENENFDNDDHNLRYQEYKNLNNKACKRLLGHFIKNNPKLWNEDIGEL